jgi:prevent-host-death family protein
MINLSRDIQSLSTFKRNTNELISQMKETGNPIVLTVNGKAELVVQDAVAYQKLLDTLEKLETLIGIQHFPML